MCIVNLANYSFVRFPRNTAGALYEQYTSDLNYLLYKQAPKVSHTFTRHSAKWILDSLLPAKAVKCQFEKLWRKYNYKSPHN